MIKTLFWLLVGYLGGMCLILIEWRRNSERIKNMFDACSNW